MIKIDVSIWKNHSSHLIPQDMWFLKGLFTRCDFDCEFVIATNGLYGIKFKCSGLNPMKPIIGNK